MNTPGARFISERTNQGDFQPYQIISHLSYPERLGYLRISISEQSEYSLNFQERLIRNHCAWDGISALHAALFPGRSRGAYPRPSFRYRGMGFFVCPRWRTRSPSSQTTKPSQLRWEGLVPETGIEPVLPLRETGF